MPRYVKQLISYTVPPLQLQRTLSDYLYEYYIPVFNRWAVSNKFQSISPNNINYEMRRFDQLKVKKFQLRRIYNVSDVKTMIGGNENMGHELEPMGEPAEPIFTEEKDIFEEAKNIVKEKEEEEEQEQDDLDFNIELLRKLIRQ